MGHTEQCIGLTGHRTIGLTDYRDYRTNGLSEWAIKFRDYWSNGLTDYPTTRMCYQAQELSIYPSSPAAR